VGVNSSRMRKVPKGSGLKHSPLVLRIKKGGRGEQRMTEKRGPSPSFPSWKRLQQSGGEQYRPGKGEREEARGVIRGVGVAVPLEGKGKRLRRTLSNRYAEIYYHLKKFICVNHKTAYDTEGRKKRGSYSGFRGREGEIYWPSVGGVCPCSQEGGGGHLDIREQAHIGRGLPVASRVSGRRNKRGIGQKVATTWRHGPKGGIMRGGFAQREGAVLKEMLTKRGEQWGNQAGQGPGACRKYHGYSH